MSRIRAKYAVMYSCTELCTERSLEGRCSGDDGEVTCLPGISACGLTRTHCGAPELVKDLPARLTIPPVATRRSASSCQSLRRHH